MDDEVVRDLVAMGKFLGSIDAVGVKAAQVSGRRTSAPEPPRRLAVPPAAAAPSPVGPPPRDRGEAEAALKAIRDDLGDCKRCRLCEGRTKIVFGQGNAVAELMFVGEAPGADEDASGLAFVGRAGELLTDMIEKGMRMPRSEVFIANVIKCRPPGNRPPENDEVTQCQPFLEAQIRTIKPRAIVALGATAARFMTKSGDPISRLRGRFASWEGIPLMPTYHPAYLLRNPSAKKDVWADLKLVLNLLGRRLD
jgi:uracil-DNA glycosylase family 4